MPRLNELIVTDEIRRVIAEAIDARRPVNAGQSAVLIAKAHPECGLSVEEISEEIFETAIFSRIPVVNN